MTKTTILYPRLAVKASRGTLSLWVKSGRYGAGIAPQPNQRSWPAHLLAAAASDILSQGYSLRIVQHD